ncbi:macro domain-like protein [Aspergillus campestris IBT 28561]|uniref:Macro domain-like protein n=1 Tax=Aspergillus campestris (strain IBT 28561) TaxID=1392248 RepID=A0A2I1DHE7_ASPC2|nr:macro domain-like protein [Aspergillus campestris IBT 28561]PKY09289.1 macro domain-like protein [Aspergillus campestris IBT 28561]
MTANIPEIILLCQDADFITAFHTAQQEHWPELPSKLTITPINSRLKSLDPSVTFDLVVSPANSYGRLDGAFDDAISLAFSPRDDYGALTRAVQTELYEKWRGFAPPSTCTLVRFPAPLEQNPRGCTWVAICPTMREPTNVVWDREVVYESIWSLLCQVEGHNRVSGEKINSLLMPPLAAGVGRVSKERWSAQTVLAMKHFVDAVEKPERWGRMQWGEIMHDCDEVATTWKTKE